jgi:hypothetical protein
MSPTAAKSLAGAALLVTLFTAHNAQAFEMGRPFDRVSTTVSGARWAYSSLTRLEQAGFSTGSPANTFTGKRELTRYDFAVAVERIHRSFQSRVLSATEPGSLRTSLDNFRRLLYEFAPDIEGLGQDVSEMKSQLETLDQRLARLEQTNGSASPATLLPERDFGKALKERGFGGPQRPAVTALNDPFGLVSLPDALKAHAPLSMRPGIAARLGSARFGFNVDRPDSLVTMSGLPLEDPADSLSYQAQLSLPLGSYWLSAFYGRDSAASDSYRLGNPFFQFGASEGLGGALSGQFSDRLAFRVETARYQSLDDDLQRMIYLKGGLRYAVGSGFSVNLGVERSRQFGLPGSIREGIGYTFGVGRSFGRNTNLSLLYRTFGADGSGAANSGGRDQDTSAITQLTVKF